MGPDNDDEKVVYVGERRKKKADPKEAVNITPFVVIIVLSLLALLASVFLGYRDHRINNEKIAFFEKRAVMIVEKLERINAANAYRDRLKMDGVKITRSSDLINVSGEIINNGTFSVSDIVVTVYLLDEHERIISQESFVSEPPGGMLLTTGVKRSFNFPLTTPSSDTREIVPVITEITTAEQNNQ